MNEAQTAIQSFIDWSSVIDTNSMKAVFSGIAEIIPIVAPAVIGFIGVRKGWSFLKSQLRGA